MNDQLLQRIRQCPTLPSLPAIAMDVLDMAQREEVDIAEIARIISKDPALSSKILRTVNSSFYGRSQSISQVSQALVILGLQSVKTLVLQAEECFLAALLQDIGMLVLDQVLNEEYGHISEKATSHRQLTLVEK